MGFSPPGSPAFNDQPFLHVRKHTRVLSTIGAWRMRSTCGTILALMLGSSAQAQFGVRHVIAADSLGPGSYPGGIATFTFDIENDGDPDVILSGARNVVYRNDGSGGYDDERVIMGGALYPILAVGDANGDGAIDLVCRDVNMVRFMLNDGAGAFSPAPIAQWGGTVDDDASLGDLDGDGDLDVLLCNYSAKHLEALINDGTGDLTSVLPVFSSTQSLKRPSLVDIDGDGDLDVLGPTGNVLWIMVNVGFGSFAQVQITPTLLIQCVQSADLDHDGYMDVLMQLGQYGTGPLVRLKGNGPVSFLPIDTLLVSCTLNNGMTLTDVDNDGWKDVLYSSWAVPKWLPNDALGSFLPPVSAMPGFQPSYNKVWHESLIDRDLDGDMDLLCMVREGYHYAFIDQLTPGAFEPTPHWIHGSWSFKYLVPADVDGDGRMDLIGAPSTGYTEDQVVNLFLNDDTPDLAPRQIILDSTGLGLAMTMVDVDVDGDADLLIGKSTNDRIALCLNDGFGSFGPPQTVYSGALSPQHLVVKDVTSDGLPDLLATFSAHGSVYLFTNTGAGFGPGTPVFTPGGWVSSVHVGDIDEDGDQDLACAMSDLPPNKGFVWSANDGTGVFSTSFGWISAQGESIRLCTMADHDADGDIDLVYERSTSSLTSLLRLAENDGTGNFTQTDITASQPLCSDLELADIDQDGLLDLLTTIADVSLTELRLNQGNLGSSSPIIVTNLQLLPSAVTAMDMDSDGDLDIAVASQTNEELSWYENPGLITWSAASPSSVSSLLFAPNPARGSVTVWSDSGIDLVALIDLQGRTILEHRPLGERTIELDLIDVPSGPFLVKTVDGNGRVRTGKLIVQAN